MRRWREAIRLLKVRHLGERPHGGCGVEAKPPKPTRVVEQGAKHPQPTVDGACRVAFPLAPLLWLRRLHHPALDV